MFYACLFHDNSIFILPYVSTHDADAELDVRFQQKFLLNVFPANIK